MQRDPGANQVALQFGEVKSMNKPLHVKVNDGSTVKKSESGKTGGFKSSVPANSIRPKPVVMPKAK